MKAPPPVLVVGAGTMGEGIAQVAVSTGHLTHIVDTSEAQLDRAQAGILKRLTSKGASGDEVSSRLFVHHDLAGAAEFVAASAAGEAPVVVEAIVENLEAKRSLLAEAQALLGLEGVYATNTSSFSVTAIAAGTPHPERVVGLHFFNPVPVMKLVEVVAGVQTDSALVDRVCRLAAAWGKVPIVAKSTPGFIVNRVARPYYGEALRIVEEGVASFDVIDRLLRDGGAFRMGPFELMDLVGNDVNSTVTRSVWEGHQFDPRFAPSNLQGELVAAGRFGRKTGHGFYSYAEGGPTRSDPVEFAPDVVGEAAHDVIAALLRRLGISAGAAGEEPGTWDFGETGRLILTRGRSATAEAALAGVPVVVVDRVLDVSRVRTLAYSRSESSAGLVAALAKAGADAGMELVEVADLPGLVVARVVSMLINEACEVIHAGLCAPADVDLAMRLGTNYPLGLLEWGDRWRADFVESLIDALSDQYRDPRYRASLTIRRASLVGTSLLDR